MTDQVYDNIKDLAGAETAEQQALLQLFCETAVTTLTARLQTALQEEGCREALLSAACLMALAAFLEMEPMTNAQQIQVGTVTVRPGGSAAAVKGLRQQAEALIAPYCEDGFAFLGV